MGNMEDAHYVRYALDAARRAGLADHGPLPLTTVTNGQEGSSGSGAAVKAIAEFPLREKTVQRGELFCAGGNPHARSHGTGRDIDVTDLHLGNSCESAVLF